MALDARSRCAALGDHLIEPAVKPCQRVRHAIGRMRSCCGRRRARLRCRIGVGHALELPRQVVETLVDRREVLVGFVVVVRLSI
jgi:hypothetical protein